MHLTQPLFKPAGFFAGLFIRTCFPRLVSPEKVRGPFWRGNQCQVRMMASNPEESPITYLNQVEAITVDEELMGPLGFSVDQLMELAGLSVACSLASEYPKRTHSNVLVIAGPGNNGGDGLVAARHLYHFGYNVQIAYPKPNSKPTQKPLFDGLVTQCNNLNIKFLSVEDLRAKPLKDSFDVILEGIFGFGFKGIPGSPFDVVLKMLKPDASPPPIVSIDIPSGWQVETGDESGDGIRPEMLVSLTAPKQCAQLFEGPHHYLGGRFVPPHIREKYNLKLPEYPGLSQCVKINSSGRPISNMRISYDLDVLREDEMDADPVAQFMAWFKAAEQSPDIVEPNAMSLASVDSNGQPSTRIVLLKGVDQRGFVFYTDYTGRKGTELIQNKKAALCFYWEALHRQVRVEGPVEELPATESDEYFNSRPRGSRIGAWASKQSSVIQSREELEEKVRKLNEKYRDENTPIPRPETWGGFVVRPLVIEFWQGRPSRLHDRMRYRRGDLEKKDWILERLSP